MTIYVITVQFTETLCKGDIVVIEINKKADLSQR